MLLFDFMFIIYVYICWLWDEYCDVVRIVDCDVIFCFVMILEMELSLWL